MEAQLLVRSVMMEMEFPQMIWSAFLNDSMWSTKEDPGKKEELGWG